MPSVFLSYSRADLPFVEELESRLTASSDIEIWRDQEKIYGGRKWPKVLGQAIADKDVFLLAWSKKAEESHFVEFEWCTAIALKKNIIPCLLDDTPLPASLRTFHGSDARQLPKAFEEITRWIGEPRTTHPDRAAKVIYKLDDIEEIEPRKVLAAAKAIFDQRNWRVQGNVIQGEHVTVTIGQGPTEPAKSLLERWQTWLTFALGILTAIGLAADLPQTISLSKLDRSVEDKKDSNVSQLMSQPLGGTVYGGNKPLPGVQVWLSELDEKTFTDKNGQFHFDVRGPKDYPVEVNAHKTGYRIERQFATLGNVNLRFQMAQEQQ